MVLATIFYFYCWRKMKKHVFSHKNGLTPATYYVIYHNHSNWPSLNLSQNVREGWTKSYWKRQVLMFYPLEKNSEEPYGGGGVASTPPTLVRPRVNSVKIIIFVIIAHVRDTKILAWLQSFRDKISVQLHCLAIPMQKRLEHTKKTKPNIENWMMRKPRSHV